jgi:cation:H+ antiporter
MLTNVMLFIAGLVALLAGAESLVRGASRIALSFGVTPLVVGLTIVALGTSSPELAVSIGAVLAGNSDLAIGNVIGSNIFNVLVIVGLSALAAPLVIHAQVVRQEVPIMIGAALLLAVVILDARLGRLDGALLLVLLAGYIVFLVRQARAETRRTQHEYEEAMPRQDAWDRHWSVQLLLIAAGLGLLVLGSEWLVSSSVAFARALGVSDLIIGLTIIAAGTSLPEVATSVLAALRGERDIAVGNAIGSSTFNILGCLGAAGLVSSSGLTIAPAVMNFDLWVMVAVSVACLPVFMAGRQIGRLTGVAFIAYYAAYVTYLILDAQGHDALPEYSSIMIGFVLPITVVTLVALVVRTQQKKLNRDPS